MLPKCNSPGIIYINIIEFCFGGADIVITALSVCVRFYCMLKRFDCFDLQQVKISNILKNTKSLPLFPSVPLLCT